MHGHTFEVTLCCSATGLDEHGFSVDFLSFDESIARIVAKYDHRHLNDLLPNPTCEKLAQSIFCDAIDDLPRMTAVEVNEIGVGRIRFSPLPH